MRSILIVLAASATCSLAVASNFTVPSGNQPALPSTQVNVEGSGPIATTAVPAPGAAVMGIAGLAALSRRRRNK